MAKSHSIRRLQKLLRKNVREIIQLKVKSDALNVVEVLKVEATLQTLQTLRTLRTL
jgi:ribosome-binding factor A